MLQSKSFLAVDFGAGSLKLAEFEVNEAGGLRLIQYGIKSLGQEGAQENTREAAILKAKAEAEALLKDKNAKLTFAEIEIRLSQEISKLQTLERYRAGRK